MIQFVKSIDYVAVKHLRLAAKAYKTLGVVRVTGGIPWAPIHMAGLAQLTIESAEDKGVRVYTTKVAARLQCGYAEGMALNSTFGPSPVALRLSLTDGTQLVLGLSCAPYPVVKVEAERGERASDNAMQKLSASWECDCPPLVMQ